MVDILHGLLHADREGDRSLHLSCIRGMIPWCFAIDKSLKGLHLWTGCDTLSAFAGQGKMKALKILLRDQKFIYLFASLGTGWNITNDVFCIIQEFVCQLYFHKVTKVNELRFQMFRNTRGELKSAQLPPCEETLLQHTHQSTHQTAMWQQSSVNSYRSQGHRWTASEDGSRVIQWMT